MTCELMPVLPISEAGVEGRWVVEIVVAVCHAQRITHSVDVTGASHDPNVTNNNSIVENDITQGPESDELSDACDPVPISLARSVLANGYIDPRVAVGGIDQAVLEFTRRPFNRIGGLPDVSNFRLAFEIRVPPSRQDDLPGIANVELMPDLRTVVVTFGGPILTGDWIVLDVQVLDINGAPSAPSIRFAHLPGDVNQGGMVNIRDATAFGEEFRGAQRPEFIDLDRSGAVTISDADEFGRIWLGTGRSLRPWRGVSLPSSP